MDHEREGLTRKKVGFVAVTTPLLRPSSISNMYYQALECASGLIVAASQPSRDMTRAVNAAMAGKKCKVVVYTGRPGDIYGHSIFTTRHGFTTALAVWDERERAFAADLMADHYPPTGDEAC